MLDISSFDAWAHSRAIRNLEAKIIKKKRVTAIKKLKVYSTWFLQEVMQAEKYNTIVIIPIENISPRERGNAM